MLAPRLLVVAAALAAFSAAASAQAPLADAQSAARALVAGSRAARLTCAPLPVALECLVDGERRPVAIGADAFRAYYPAGGASVQLLTPELSHDYDVYYEFDRAAFDAALAGDGAPLSGKLVENVERVPPRSMPAVCTVAKKLASPSYYALTGTLDLGSKALVTSRGGDSPLIDAKRGVHVDERCGELAAPAESHLNYYVTPRHYWGEDILQIPLSAVGAGPEPFMANLHLCQYDGEWHASENVALTCTLTR